MTYDPGTGPYLKGRHGWAVHVHLPAPSKVVAGLVAAVCVVWAVSATCMAVRSGERERDAIAQQQRALDRQGAALRQLQRAQSYAARLQAAYEPIVGDMIDIAETVTGELGRFESEDLKGYVWALEDISRQLQANYGIGGPEPTPVGLCHEE